MLSHRLSRGIHRVLAHVNSLSASHAENTISTIRIQQLQRRYNAKLQKYSITRILNKNRENSELWEH